jgi:very-short-patch-repair endonuclease
VTQSINNQETRSKLIQIFRYLQALNQLRNPVQKEIQQQPWLMWFHDLPDHPSIRRGAIEDTSSEFEGDEATNIDDFILKVSRPKLTNPPDPPKEIVLWLQPGWQQIDGKVIVESSVRSGTGNQMVTINFSDDPQRKRLLEEWKIRRDNWLESERPARAAYDIFDKLYALQSQIERESERIELMLGDGLLNWQPSNNFSIYHPVLLLRVQLRFDPNIPEFTLIDTGQSSELYTAVFQTAPGINALDIARCREDHESGRWHPLGGEETTRFFKRFVNRLSSSGEFIEPHKLKQFTNAPRISRDPVLFLRPRTLGISTALESILEILPQSISWPYSLTSLVGIEAVSNELQDKQISTRTIDSPNGEDENILLSKPANAEQLEIARRLDKYGAVLVQGPPGTGKTHTIANLIGHLLAQGKSVLVTSEKPKALRVLREKVVEPLQPLCASILEDDNRKAMESTIDAISERLANSDADKLEREAIILARQRIEILRQLRETRSKLLEARSNEYRAITLSGESLSPAAAARYITKNRETARWIPGPVASGVPLPLSKSELIELYNSNGTITSKEERELLQFLPESSNLIPPFNFEEMVSEQIQLVKENLDFRRDLWFSATSNYSSEALQNLQRHLVQEIEPLRDLVGWRLAAILAGREGGARRQAWDDLLIEVENVHNYAAQAQLRILKYDPYIPEDCLPGRVERVLDEIIEYLSQGGKLNSFKLLTKRDWKILIEGTRVKGKQPEILEHFQVLRDIPRLWAARTDLVRRWQRQMAILGGPNANILGPEPERTFYQFIDPLRRCLNWYMYTWFPLEGELKKQGFNWDLFWAETPVVHNEYGDILRLRTSVIERLPQVIVTESYRRRYAQIDAKLLEYKRNLEQAGNHTTQTEVVHALKDAVSKRNIEAYRLAYQKLINLHSKSDVLRRRQALLTKLEKAAPGWSAAIRERIDYHGERNIPGDPEEAWLWRQLYEELDRRAKTSLEELQEQISQLNNELFRITAELVEKKAWAQQVRHTSLEQRRALQGWRELMKKVGKGTGKRAPRLLAQARELMPICQTAVPVWIMPLSYVTRNFDMKRNHFDVVIIDEASQADITALIAVFMGSRVVVVGDHEQVSPMAVGQKLDEVQHLIDEYLQDIPLAQLYDGKLSIYGLARTTFEPVCLLEHFRCVSPIIQFSNALSYDGKIKPLRDDSDVSRRPATIAYPVKSFSKNGKVNTEEANVIASLLMAAVEQPEYKDATFGVLSMVSVDQALFIETILRKYMSPTEYIQRRVLCGDPPQFQGDERDVMFLSIVDVPGEGNGPLGLRTEEGHDDMFKKRYNVAASRARDQMWVIYSLDPDTDLKPTDIRRRLILHARDQHKYNTAHKEQEQKIESEFEKQVFNILIRAGYNVTTQWPVGAYRIDMVVEGNGKRLAVECDGDRWHPLEKLEEDMARQAILERLGWRFMRIRGSQFFRNPEQAMKPIFARLETLGIPPQGMSTKSTHVQDGNELKGRIIRRANELRQQWEDLGTRSISSKQDAQQYGVASNIAPIIKASPTADSKSQIRVNTSYPTDVPKPLKIVESSTDKSERNRVVPASRPPLKSSSLSQQNDNKEAFNVIIYLQMKGLKVIDNRDNRGGIWVVGGMELSSLMQTIAARGIHFKFVPGGIPQVIGSRNQYIDGWFTKSIPD